VWIGVLLLLLFPAALALSPLERRGRSPDAKIPSAPRQIAGAILLCLGISLLAVFGYGGGVFAYQGIASFALVVAGAELSGLLPRLRRRS
jgi:hypothetical protein